MTQPRRRPHTTEAFSFERAGLTFQATIAGPADGELVTLLHGFPGSRATWDGVAPRLDAAGMRTVTLEQRGYGPTARPGPVASYRLGELAGDVLALLDHVDAGSTHLVGHDWGGFVSWYLAATRPERVRTLTVLSTPHPRALSASLTRSLQGVRSLYALAFQAPRLPETILTAGGGRVLRMALQQSGLDGERARRYAGDLADPGAMRAALNWYRAAFRYPTDSAVIGPITVPTSYVWSRRDTALGGTAARLTELHVDVDYRFVVLDEVSHWIPELAPEITASLIVDRIRSV